MSPKPSSIESEKVKEDSENVGLKLNSQKTMIMASGLITSWQIETMEMVRDFIFWGSKITADGVCRHEIKRHLLLGRRAMTDLGEVTQSCPTLCDPMDCSLPGLRGILQARILEWVTISFSRGSS